jgi:predicted nucleic acid-binding protein
MEHAYFDTSALIKRYVDEPGRREVLKLLRTHRCVVSAVLPVEVRSALRRRTAEQTLDVRRMPSILRRFAGDRAYWTVIEVSSEVLAVAESLSGTHPLRTLDSIHVASATLFLGRAGLGSFTFVSADARQTRVADALGLTTRYVGAEAV